MQLQRRRQIQARSACAWMLCSSLVLVAQVLLRTGKLYLRVPMKMTRYRRNSQGSRGSPCPDTNGAQKLYRKVSLYFRWSTWGVQKTPRLVTIPRNACCLVHTMGWPLIVRGYWFIHRSVKTIVADFFAETSRPCSVTYPGIMMRARCSRARTCNRTTLDGHAPMSSA